MDLPLNGPTGLYRFMAALKTLMCSARKMNRPKTVPPTPAAHNAATAAPFFTSAATAAGVIDSAGMAESKTGEIEMVE